MDLGPSELLIILLIALLLFGGSKLPTLARSLGKAKKEFQEGLAEGARDAAPARPAESPPQAVPAPEPVDGTKAPE